MKTDSGEHTVSFRISALDQIIPIKYLQNVTFFNITQIFWRTQKNINQKTSKQTKKIFNIY